MPTLTYRDPWTEARSNDVGNAQVAICIKHSLKSKPSLCTDAHETASRTAHCQVVCQDTQDAGLDNHEPRQQPLHPTRGLLGAGVVLRYLALVERHLVERDHLRLLDELVPKRQQYEERLR